MRIENPYHSLEFSVIDFETGIKNRGENAVGKNKASPFHPDNNIVWYGNTAPTIYQNCQASRYPPEDWGTHEFRTGRSSASLQQVLASPCGLLVGHNIKFDLLHLMTTKPVLKPMLENWLESGGQIWDTMVVEYLLTGQESQFISLDKCATKYGGSVKDERLKTEYWEKDIDTEEIPAEIIMPYLEGDLRNAAIIFFGQMRKINTMGFRHKQNFLNLIKTQMDALLATTMIEANGIHFDVPNAADAAADLAILYENTTEQLQKKMAIEFNFYRHADQPDIKMEHCNPASTQQLSALIAGGPFKYKAPVPVLDDDGNPIKYKSGIKEGQVKTKITELQVEVTGLLHGEPHHLESTSHGYRLDESSLKKLLERCRAAKQAVCAGIIEQVLSHRSMQKELKVSYIGLLELTWPTDSCIHGNLNHCATSTGRLSSSAPNQQNFSSKEVKE